jgi:hypothetical protein
MTSKSVFVHSKYRSNRAEKLREVTDKNELSHVKIFNSFSIIKHAQVQRLIQDHCEQTISLDNVPV